MVNQQDMKTKEVSLPIQEEALVTDSRASLTPAQQVEQKLLSLLRSHAVPISHVQMMATGLRRNRV